MSVTATASLTWNLPNPAVSPKAVDHGSAVGARGQVTSNATDGSPVGYLIAPNDTEGAIADRFGITTEDLEWLNPDRYTVRFILANITINLSTASRGLHG